MPDDHDEQDLGLGLAPGSEQYRAFVGPPEDYDRIAATTFGLLTAAGLRQHHTVLDIGCGSLRVGRLLIPYLNQGGYTGFEPNRWLIEEGIARECGRDQIQLKRPEFVVAESPHALREPLDTDGRFDFLFAQSIFSHMGLPLIADWLAVVQAVMRPDGVFLATYLEAQDDFEGTGWIYPGCVAYRSETLERTAQAAGLVFKPLSWSHPRQTWALVVRPGHRLAESDSRALSWRGDFEDGSEG